jgi:hypothetical protein
VADLTVPLNGASSFPQNISIAGVNLLLTGINTRQLAIGDSNTPTQRGSFPQLSTRL